MIDDLIMKIDNSIIVASVVKTSVTITLSFDELTIIKSLLVNLKEKEALK